MNDEGEMSAEPLPKLRLSRRAEEMDEDTLDDSPSLRIVLSLDDGTLAHYFLAERESRLALTAALPDLLRRMRPSDVRVALVPALFALSDFDTSSLVVAQSLSEVFGAGEGFSHPEAFLHLTYALLINIDHAVAKEASESVRHIMREVPSESAILSLYWVPMIIEMAQSPWTQARASAARLLSELTRCATHESSRETIRTLYTSLATDPSVTVRRAVVEALAQWPEALPSSQHVGFLGAIVDEAVANDRQEGLRVAVASALVDVGRYVAAQALSAVVVAPMRKLARDVSWRVRFTVARAVGPAAVIVASRGADAGGLLPVYEALVRDVTIEVRTALAENLSPLCSIVQMGDFAKKVVPMVCALMEGAKEWPALRVALTQSIPRMVRVLWKACPDDSQELIDEVVRPLLRDNDDFVKRRAIEGLKFLPIDAFQPAGTLCAEVAAALTSMAQSSSWRLREAVAEEMRHVASQYSPSDFNGTLRGSLESLLLDGVAVVRGAAITTLASLSTKLGSDWAADTLMSLMSMARAPTYTTRLVFVACLGSMGVEALSSNSSSRSRLAEELSGAIRNLVKDPVESVRLRCVTALGTLQSSCIAPVAQECLSILAKDKSVDVRTAATKPTIDEPF